MLDICSLPKVKSPAKALYRRKRPATIIMVKKRVAVFCLVAGIMVVSLFLNVWGIRKSLPYGWEIDEPTHVVPAARMAATGSANPGWFGHPGSTVTYPLTAIFWLRYGAGAQQELKTSPGQFYLTARLLTILYAVMTIPFIYLVGREAFGASVGVMAAWLFAICPLVIFYAQIVRSDSAAVFFGALSLWRILKTYQHPSARNHLWAGLAIGLGISSRYFMASLVPLLIAVDCVLLYRTTETRRKILTASCVGILSVVAAFALSTPYLFLDFQTARRNLQREARVTQLGADGLSPVGNLWWYLSDAIPRGITRPLALLALLGGLIALFKRRFSQFLLLGYVVIFLLGISALALHWPRWVIPIVPVFVLLAGLALDTGARRIAGLWKRRAAVQYSFLAVCLAAVSVQPAYAVVVHDIKDSHPNTRVLAREWMVKNAPAGSRVADEGISAPLLHGAGFLVTGKRSIAEGRTVEDYRREGFDYLILSEHVRFAYLHEPERYRTELDFYQDLAKCARLVASFDPSSTRGGHGIRIYQLAQGKAP